MESAVGPQDPPGDEPVPHRKRDSAATREALLIAAKLSFMRNGFDGTSTREIAAMVGVNQSLVYRYFGSKEGLFFAAAAAKPPVSELLDAGVEVRQLPVPLAEKLLGEVPDPAGEHPMIGLLTSAAHEPIRRQMRLAFAQEFSTKLGAELAGDDAELRAELVAALMIGTGILRTVIKAPRLSEASIPEIAALIDRAAQRLIDEH